MLANLSNSIILILGDTENKLAAQEYTINIINIMEGELWYLGAALEINPDIPSSIKGPASTLGENRANKGIIAHIKLFNVIIDRFIIC